MNRWVIGMLALAGSGGFLYGSARAQTNEGCLSFSHVQPDRLGEGRYTIPLAHGSFADVEMVSTSDAAGQVQISVFDDSGVLREQGTAVLIPHRLLMVGDALRVANLFEIAPVLTLEITADVPAKLVEVRRD